jgi:hypothetical protein
MKMKLLFGGIIFIILFIIILIIVLENTQYKK